MCLHFFHLLYLFSFGMDCFNCTLDYNFLLGPLSQFLVPIFIAESGTALLQPLYGLFGGAKECSGNIQT